MNGIVKEHFNCARLKRIQRDVDNVYPGILETIITLTSNYDGSQTLELVPHIVRYKYYFSSSNFLTKDVVPVSIVDFFCPHYPESISPPYGIHYHQVDGADKTSD